ncbi:MAG: hypothetical protein M0015_18740 [Betaproteobacteria bacterium]|nr:hypothetical protein [Betaproteobacteria bacterium]
MRFAVVTIEPEGYAHSAAFAEVAAALREALTGLGHDAVLCANTVHADRINVLLGAHLLGGIAPGVLPAQTVIYNLEQLGPALFEARPFFAGLLRAVPVWDYHPANLRMLAQMGARDAQLVRLGYVRTLTRIAHADEQDIDVLFYGSRSERRRAVIKALAGAGLHVRSEMGLYGSARDELIARSKIVLNLGYFDDVTLFEQVRVTYLLANQAFVVSESGRDPEEEARFSGGIAFAPYAELVGTCLHYAARQKERARIASRGFEIARGMPQERFLAPAIAPLARRWTR